MKFTQVSGIVLDMDGVLWRGDEALPGLALLFAWLRESRTPYVLATNNSSKTPADYVAKLARLGILDVPPSAVITSAIATAHDVRSAYPAGTPVYVIGMQGIRQALEEAGFDLEDRPEGVQAVVVGVDFSLTYDKLKQAALHIRSGAAFIATNGDRTFPSPEGLIPGAGSIVAALQAATDVAPRIIGKPHAPMFLSALSLLGSSAERTLMVGDRLDTDIQGAKAVGMQTALVFTGVTQAEDLAASDVWPDVAYDDLVGLIRAWAGDDWWRSQVKAARQ